MRSLPTGLVLIIGSRPPDRRWLARLAVLSVLYASGLFPLLFLAAYLLPGGVAAVINSLSPLLVVVLSVPLLGAKIRSGPGRRRRARGGRRGPAGAALGRRLDPLGLLAMTGAATMMGTATVLTKRWGRPPGMSSDRDDRLDLPARRTHPAADHAARRGSAATSSPARNIGGLVYLVLISGIARVRAVVLGSAVPDGELRSPSSACSTRWSPPCSAGSCSTSG